MRDVESMEINWAWHCGVHKSSLRQFVDADFSSLPSSREKDDIEDAFISIDTRKKIDRDTLYQRLSL